MCCMYFPIKKHALFFLYTINKVLSLYFLDINIVYKQILVIKCTKFGGKEQKVCF